MLPQEKDQGTPFRLCLYPMDVIDFTMPFTHYTGALQLSLVGAIAWLCRLVMLYFAGNLMQKETINPPVVLC